SDLPVGKPEDQSTWDLKPDVVAPGSGIIAAASADSYLWNHYPERRVSGVSGGEYLTLSGSSMASGVVSGAVADILSSNPMLNPAQVKFALQYTAEPIEGFGLIEQGAGSINVPL